MNFSIILFSILVCGTKLILSDNPAVIAFKELKSKLSDGIYDKDMSPKLGEDTPVEVGITLHITDYRLKEMEKRLYTVMYFRQMWNDQRLQNPNRELKVVGGQSIADKIWRPDTFFSNSVIVKSFESPVPNIFVRVDPNGDVMLSQRLENHFRCRNGTVVNSMDCILEIESYGFSMRDIVFKWPRAQQSVGMASEVNPDSDYQMVGHNVLVKQENLPTGNYSRLLATFSLNKRCKHCTITTTTIAPEANTVPAGI